jgi:hypothetical protein
MPARRVLLPFAMVLLGTALPAVVARAAGGATAEELVAKAQASYEMQCGTFNVSWSCGNWPWSVGFEPLRGEVTHLIVQSDEDETDGMDPAAQAMMLDFVDAVCLDPSGDSAFVTRVASLVAPGEVAPSDVAFCHLTGGYRTGCEFGCYWVDAMVQEPPPTPTPTPFTTLSPTPTTAPTATVPPGVTPTPTASATQSPGLPTASSSSASGAPSWSAQATGGGTASVGESAGPTPTQEQEVAAGNPTPSPSADSAGSAPVQPGAGRFASSVPSLGQVSIDPAALGGSALLAILLVLFVAFPGELFNDTVESNFDEISSWFRHGPLGAIGRAVSALPRGPFAIVLFVAAAAFLNALLDPGLGFDLQSLATYLGFLVALVVTLVAFDGPPLLVHRRRTGELGSMRVLLWTLPIVVFLVVVSRVAELQPGYLYGIVLGIVFVREDTPRDEGREQAAGAAWTLAVAAAAWLLLSWLRSTSTSPAAGDFVGIAAQTALAAVMVAGIEAVALGLLPFRFLPGAAIYRWSRLGWAALFGIGIFAFVHVLIGPNLGYVSELSMAGLAAAAAAFVAFGIVSLGVWGYFRFRPVRAAAG